MLKAKLSPSHPRAAAINDFWLQTSLSLTGLHGGQYLTSSVEILALEMLEMDSL